MELKRKRPECKCNSGRFYIGVNISLQWHCRGLQYFMTSYPQDGDMVTTLS